MKLVKCTFLLLFFSFFFQSLVKWSPPDDDNKCLGEVFLTMDPKHRGSPTGNVRVCQIELVHDAGHLYTRLKTDGKEAMPRGFSGG